MTKGKATIVTLVFALIAIVSVIYENYFISHICFLFMGMMLGSLINKNQATLEKWARNKIRSPYA